MSYFDDPGQLGAGIATFVAEGLSVGEPAVVLTRPAHHALITAELYARGVDVEAAIAAGDLLLLDAEETLATLMNGSDMPDAAIYHRNVGAVVSSLLRGRPGPVRIFGDMVDLLWQRGQYDAAIRVELLSNELAVLQPISVICGYSIGHFLKRTEKLQQVEQLHGRMHETSAVVHDRGRSSTQS
jgi:hypothetical protein